MKDRARVHFHAYTMETIATVVLYGKKQIAAGEQIFAQLRLTKPVLLLPGDRFILRQFSPVVTIGGGVVLDAAPVAKLSERDAFLETMSGGEAQAILQARIARRHHQGISIAQLITETGLTRQAIGVRITQLVRLGEIMRMGDTFLSAPVIEELKLLLPALAGNFHRANPLVHGFGKEELREQAKLSGEVFAAVLDLLVRAKKLEVAGDSVRLPGHGVVMKDEEAESKKIIESAFAAAGLKVPALKDVLAGLKVDKARAQKIVTLLLREKVLVKISEELVFHRSALEEFAQATGGGKSEVAKN